jgi:hypothetical protein
MPFEPKLPDGVKLPEGFSIRTDDPRYVALHSLAEREKWSQAAFSETLAIESRRVSAEHERARAPAPAPPTAAASGVPANWDKLAMQARFAHALANPKRG